MCTHHERSTEDRTFRATRDTGRSWKALFATAVAQVLVAVVALSADMGSTGPIWPRDVLFLTVFFAALWVTSAFLFRHAASEAPAEAEGQEV